MLKNPSPPAQLTSEHATEERERLKTALIALLAKYDCRDLPRGERCARVRCVACDARELLEGAHTMHDSQPHGAEMDWLANLVDGDGRAS